MQSSCVRVYLDSPLSDKVALFNTHAKSHVQNQSSNPFSNNCKAGSMPKPKFSKEEYGKPIKGSLSESRGFKATLHVCKEMLQLCEIIDLHAEPLFSAEENKNGDPRKVISFGELFNIYTVISDKLVGMLLRARKHKLVDFEGECLFQRRDDHVPIILLKPLSEIRKIFNEKIEVAKAAMQESQQSK